MVTPAGKLSGAAGLDYKTFAGAPPLPPTFSENVGNDKG
jgi:hypothetical protein